jgi:ATP synthase F1 epsilon subunit
MATLNLDIVTPIGPVVSTTVDWINAVGVSGELGILPGHLPLLTGLKPGALSFRRQGETYTASAGAGFLEVGPERVIVLVDEFERGEIYALRSLLEWNPVFEAEPARNAIARAETKLRALEAKGQEKTEEYQLLTQYSTTARTKLEKR